MPLPEPIGDDEAFEQLHDLLCAIAAGRASDRSEAVSYSSCRAVLLSSPRTRSLPGFVLQCMSVARFRDFITLYDPDPHVRQHFVRSEFERRRGPPDVLGGFEATPRRPAASGWSL